MLKIIDEKRFKDKIIKLLRKENIPEIIYKYMPINEYTLKNLLKNQIWFSSPKNFNDPFDCKMFRLTKPALDEIKDFLDAKTEEEVQQKIKLYKNNTEDALKVAQDKVKEIISNTYYISCFSHTKKNILMWSHYSDKHKGICLAFNSVNMFKNSNYINNNILKFLEVKYVKKYPEINIFNINNFIKDVNKVFQLKHLFWKEEKEIRFITEKKETLAFEKEALSEIVFGCELKPTDDDVKDVIKLVKSCNYPNVKFIQAIKCKDRFALEFKEMEI